MTLGRCCAGRQWSAVAYARREHRVDSDGASGRASASGFVGRALRVEQLCERLGGDGSIALLDEVQQDVSFSGGDLVNRNRDPAVLVKSVAGPKRPRERQACSRDSGTLTVIAGSVDSDELMNTKIFLRTLTTGSPHGWSAHASGRESANFAIVTRPRWKGTSIANLAVDPVPGRAPEARR